MPPSVSLCRAVPPLRRLIGAGLFAVLLAATAPCSAGGAETDAGPIVTLDSGRALGNASGAIQSFLGIPYARPPIGDLRWRPPQAPAPWRGVRPARHYGSDCAQMPYAHDMAPLRTTPGEDCLYLNVWRPAETPPKPRPVLVWIHGGGFVTGGSSPAVYDGSAFARAGLVFVSFNYRLGRFGFFSIPELAEEAGRAPVGNYGYLDQIAALRWVQRNIAAFGGDPQQITIMGESAGGLSVHALLASPLASGLFQRAIIESGGGRDSLLPSYPLESSDPGAPSANRIGLDFARSQGLTGRGPALLQALRALPAERIAAGLSIAALLVPPPGPLTYSGPMLDGHVLPRSPEQAYLTRDFNKAALLIGSNSRDSLFVGRDLDSALAQMPAPRYAVRAVFDTARSGDAAEVGGRVYTVRVMAEPARFVARAFASAGLPVFLYRFGYVAESRRATSPLGAGHATEIPYAFLTLPAAYGAALQDEDLRVSARLHAYWLNFALHGDPNGADLPRWPAQTRDGPGLLVFGSDGSARYETPDPWQPQLDFAERWAGPGPQPLPPAAIP